MEWRYELRSAEPFVGAWSQKHLQGRFLIDLIEAGSAMGVGI